MARQSFEAFNRSVAEGSDDYSSFSIRRSSGSRSRLAWTDETYRGPEGVRRWVEDLKRDWERYETRWEEARDLGDRRVLAFGTWHARERGGGVELGFQQAAWLIELRGTKLRRLQTFTDRAKALEAAGLRE